MELDLHGGKKIWNMLRNRKQLINEDVQINTLIPEARTTLYLRNLYQANSM